MSGLVDQGIAALIQTLARPRVVHRLPGRLRIHVPLLNRMPGDQKIDQGKVDRLVTSIPGMRCATVNRVSGNILLDYDPRILDEQRILAGMKKISRTVVKHRDRFKELSDSNKRIDIDRLAEYFHRKGDALFSAEELELPGEIWA
jgi:hypothetical protein